MDRRNLPSHTPSGARCGSRLLHQDQLDYSEQESLVPEWPEAPSPYSPENDDTDSDAQWLPLREQNRGAHSLYHADSNSLHEVPAPYDRVMSVGAFPSTNAAPSRRNRRRAANRRNSSEMEEELKAQLERLKRQHEALAAEKVRLQHVTTLMEQEVQRRLEANQRTRTPDPHRDSFR